MNSIKEIKKRFTIIIVGISLLFIADMFYLIQLYRSISEETTKIVLSCIEKADNEEIQKRLELIAQSRKDIHTIDITKSVKRNPIQSRQDTVVLSQIVMEIRIAMHNSIDSMLPMNLKALDSLIVSNFLNKGISAGLYYSEIVDLNTGTIKASSRSATEQAKTNAYIYEYDTKNKYAYKVYTASMTGSILKRMSGILVTAFLIVVLLSYAFWYFIRTVIQLKSLEEMKSDFTNNMTHELKTPIAVAYSAADTLLNFKQGESKEKREQYLTICIEQLSRLHDLVEQILSVSMEQSKKITINKETIELYPLISPIVHHHALKAGKSPEIYIEIRPETLTVYADRTHLKNIINNLIDNAIKYALDNVKITIESYIDNGYCIIIIKDNGIGISPENQKYIFDKFYRVPQGNLHNVKGFGLGLFYVKTMVEQHGGEITVRSSLNKGSEFIIKLPVA